MIPYLEPIIFGIINEPWSIRINQIIRPNRIDQCSFKTLILNLRKSNMIILTFTSWHIIFFILNFSFKFQFSCIPLCITEPGQSINIDPRLSGNLKSLRFLLCSERQAHTQRLVEGPLVFVSPDTWYVPFVNCIRLIFLSLAIDLRHRIFLKQVGIATSLLDGTAQNHREKEDEEAPFHGVFAMDT